MDFGFPSGRCSRAGAVAWGRGVGSAHFNTTQTSTRSHTKWVDRGSMPQPLPTPTSPPASATWVAVHGRHTAWNTLPPPVTISQPRCDTRQITSFPPAIFKSSSFVFMSCFLYSHVFICLVPPFPTRPTRLGRHLLTTPHSNASVRSSNAHLTVPKDGKPPSPVWPLEFTDGSGLPDQPR